MINTAKNKNRQFGRFIALSETITFDETVIKI